MKLTKRGQRVLACGIVALALAALALTALGARALYWALTIDPWVWGH